MLAALLPILPQKNQLQIQMTESQVLRSETSIISNSPLLNIQGYDSNGGFRPENSMANINSLNFADLTIRSKDNNTDNANDKKPVLFGNKLYESQIL